MITGDTSRRLAGRSDQLFYLLALFALLTVAASLYLTRRITSMFSEATTVNHAWSRRLEEYSVLGALASDVNAPGNDIFDDPSVDTQQKRMHDALAAFESARKRSIEAARSSLAGPEQHVILEGLDGIDAANREMVAEAETVFEYFRQGRHDLAGRRMAAMNRSYARLTAALRKLGADAVRIQSERRDRQPETLGRLRQAEVVLALGVVGMIVGALVYGRKTSREMREDRDERNELIARLKESEVRLEQRIEERTAHARNNERRLAQAQQLANMGSWEWDLSTNLVTWSDQNYRIFGLEPGAIAASYEAYLGFVHPDDRERASQTLSSTLEARGSFSYDHRIVWPDGTVRMTQNDGSVILDAAGTPVMMVGAIQDVTDRYAATEALRHTEERLQLAARATSDALWDWDTVTNAVWWSDGFRALFGHDGQPTLMTLIHPDDAERVGQSVHHFLEAGGESWSGEYRFKRRDGSYAWVLDRGLAVRGPDGAARRMVGSMMDISERKESERLKSDFVSFVSHQLRTPLSGMSWMLELAADSEGMPEDARGFIADARESADRLVSLVNDLLDIARLEAGRSGGVPESVPLDELTHSVLRELQPLADEKRHNVTVRFQAAAPVWGDPQLLRQVVLNLLSNAIKYTPPAGEILVSLQQQNGTAQWSVKDSGIGVPRLAQDRLFEKFYRADNVLLMEAEGTGLGLHLVRLIVEQAGGRVWCESEEGAGALFAFTWPLAKAEGERV